jgi:hypothetical protein
MKVTLLIFSLVVNSTFLPVIYASEEVKSILSSSQEVFNSKWNYTPTIIRKEGESSVHIKNFSRLLWIEKSPVTIVDTSFVYLENPQKDKEAKKNELAYIASAMKKSFGQEMVISGQGNSLTVEGKFEKINRYMKISLVKKNNFVIFVTSSIRLGMYSKLKAEVNELHNVLVQYEGKIDTKTKKTTWFSFPKVLETAHASDLGLNLGSLLGGSNSNSGSNGLPGFNYNLTGNFSGLENSVKDLNTNVGALNTNIGTANANWGVTNGVLGDSNTNWGNTNVQIGNANTNWNNTNTQIGNANTNWGDTNVQIGNANNNWNNTNKEVDKANKNWEETNKKIGDLNDTAKKAADDANKNWADTNKEISKMNDTADRAQEAANANWAESNKILAKAMDPNHMAKVAFYTAAGAALGGIAVNLAVQGISEGISFLYELFTGTKKKKLEWEDFEKAMQVWDNTLNDLIKMEQGVDSLISAFDFFEGKNLGNDYVKQLNIAMRDMRFDRDMFLEKFKDPTMDTSCRKMFYDAADELDQKVKEYEKIIQYASNNSMSITSGPSYFCNQLKDLQRKILSAETQMQDLRLKILVAENQYYGKQGDALDKRDDDIEKVNDRLSSTLKEKKAYDKKILERVEAANKQHKGEWVSACVDGKNGDGERIKEELKDAFFFTYFRKKSRCNDAYAKLEENFKKRTEESVKTMALEDELRKGMELKSNTTVEMKLSEEQMNWMARLHVDAYCYQYAHVEDSKVPAKCKEFPEMLYSMNMSKGYEKAKAAYQNKCQDRYINGLKTLAKNP